MVTHIPSPASSSASLPLAGRVLDSYRPAPSYAASQAGSVSASKRPTGGTQSREPSRSHSRAPSASSTVSSQSTLVPSAPRSVAGYPSARHAGRFVAAPSAYKPPSAASTSAARPRHGHRSSSRSRRVHDLEQEIANVFPWFGQTGDLEICLRDRRRRTEKRYRLHRLILAQNSRWFEADVARAGKAGARRGSNASATASMVGRDSGIAYNPASYGPAGPETSSRTLYYELDWTNFIDEQQRIPALIRRNEIDATWSAPLRPSAPVSNKPAMPSSSFLRNFTTTALPSTRQQPLEDSEDADVLTAYNNLFLSFYNHAPTLSTTNIATAYVDAKLLLALASKFGAIDATGPRIDHHLLQFGSRLWKQIAKYPPSYLKLGYLARSKAIFSEALIHVVDAWPAGQVQLRRGTPGVPDAVIDLIEDKVDEIEDVRLRTEAKLFRLSLTTGRGERVGPGNAYVDWLALSLFRQWVADATTPAPVGILKDSPSRDDSRRSGTGTESSTSRPQPATPLKFVRTYRLIAAGGQAYLTHDDCKRFLKLRPEDCSRDNLRKFERRMEELKNLARDAVRPLTRNSLELDVKSAEMGYLTCARCEERDFGYIWGGS